MCSSSKVFTSPQSSPGASLTLEQHPHFLERHVETAAVADELQALQMRALVQPEIALGARWRRKQTFTLVRFPAPSVGT